MFETRLKKLLKLTTVTTFLIFTVSAFQILDINNDSAEAAHLTRVAQTKNDGNLIAYYSRSGKTRMVALELQKLVSGDVCEVASKIDRSGLGVFTCVLDQLLNRDGEYAPVTKDMQRYNSIIVASPVWIQKLASPMRSFLKKQNLQGKEVYLFLTYSGHLSEDKEKAIADEIKAGGIKLKNVFKIVTKEKTDAEIKKELLKTIATIPELKKQHNNI